MVSIVFFLTLKTADGCHDGRKHQGLHESDPHIRRSDGRLDPVEVGAGISAHQDNAREISSQNPDKIEKCRENRETNQRNKQSRGLSSDHTGCYMCQFLSAPSKYDSFPHPLSLDLQCDERVMPLYCVVYSPGTPYAYYLSYVKIQT
jgi:hypothetical protein